jgi:hypothetical protein
LSQHYAVCSRLHLCGHCKHLICNAPAFLLTAFSDLNPTCGCRF